MKSLLTKIRDYVKLLRPTNDQEFCLVNNALPEAEVTTWEEVPVVSSPVDETVIIEKTQPAPVPQPEPQLQPASQLQAQPQPQPKLQSEAHQKPKSLSRKKQEKESDFVYDAFRKLTPEYMLIITEMRNLLNSEQKKMVFHALATHLSIREVAEHMHIPPQKVKVLFQEAIKDIRAKTGFVKAYLDEGTKKDYKIKALKSDVKSLRAKIQEMEAKKSLRRKHAEEKIPLKELISFLKKPYTQCLDIETRTVNIFKCADVYTLEDLVRYALENNGFENLKRIRNFGYISLKKLEDELIKKGVMEEGGHSELFQYITDSKV